MTTTEFLRKKNIVSKDKTDLIIGFSDGTQESLIELLEEYHRAKLKNNGALGDVVCSHEKTTKHMMTGIRYCANPKCKKLIDIE